jgi:hypothetical protein
LGVGQDSKDRHLLSCAIARGHLGAPVLVEDHQPHCVPLS